MLGLTNSSNAPSVVLKDTIVSTWYSLPSTGTDSDMKTQGYTYYSSISATGVTANTIAEVTFSDAQAKSGNYAPICRTYADEVRVYSKVNTSITIPSIIIHSIVESYYTVDNSPPTSGKTTAITSGAVYDKTFKGFVFGNHLSDIITLTTANTDYACSLTKDETHTNGLISSSGSVFTILKDGLVRWDTNGQLVSSTTTRVGISLYVNGTFDYASTSYCNQWSRFNNTGARYMTAGTTIEFKARSIINGDQVTNFYIALSVEAI